jgi:hypothetical protein
MTKFNEFAKISRAFTPAPGFRRDRAAGVQKVFLSLDSGLRRNDGKEPILASCEAIKFDDLSFPLRHSSFVIRPARYAYKQICNENCIPAPCRLPSPGNAPRRAGGDSTVRSSTSPILIPYFQGKKDGSSSSLGQDQDCVSLFVRLELVVKLLHILDGGLIDFKDHIPWPQPGFGR